ncbi:hypothetical protein D3C81_1787310 [compost metagenome]
MQDGLGDGQAHPGLFDHRQVAFVRQRGQLPVQLQAVTAEHQAVLRSAEQRTLQLPFKLRQLLAQPGRLDVEAASRLHEAAAAGGDAEALRQQRIDLRRAGAPGRGFIEGCAILRYRQRTAGFHEGHR